MYIVTIRREGEEYIARDEQGDWRARGNAEQAPAKKGQLLAEYLFHRDEIGAVALLNGVTCVEVLEGGAS